MLIVDTPAYVWMLYLALNGDTHKEHFKTFRECEGTIIMSTIDPDTHRPLSEEILSKIGFDGAMCIRVPVKPPGTDAEDK